MEGAVSPSAPVCVASHNVISPLGWTTGENLAALLQGRTGIQSRHPGLVPGLAVPLALIDREALAGRSRERGLDVFTPLEQLCILSVQEACSTYGVSGPDVQMILATTKGNIDLLTAEGVEEQEVFLSVMAGRIARHLGFLRTPLVVSNACISGVLAIELGADLIRCGSCREVIVVGADLVTPFVLSGFASFKSVSTRPCKPYDAARDGLSLGEAVATMILSDRVPQDASRTVFVLGGGCSNDANHISGPSRTGDGLFLAMEQALSRSHCTPAEVTWVNAHGTATAYNDEMEARAMALAGLSNTPLNGLKGYYGHTLGASGVLESVLSVASLCSGTVPATLGYDTPGVSVPLRVLDQTLEIDAVTCLKTASGFGGCNAALVFSRLPRPVEKPAFSELRVLGSCSVSSGQLMLNDTIVFEGTAEPEVFLRAAFKALDLPYMKFYKMDPLSRLAFVATEYLSGLPECSAFLGHDVALVLSNRSASLDTDLNHLRVLRETSGEASPAVFVYTLPNVLMGELCIRHQWKGRNLFLITGQYDENFMQQYVSFLLGSGRAEACLYGWVELLGSEYAANVHFAIRPGLDFGQENHQI